MAVIKGLTLATTLFAAKILLAGAVIGSLIWAITTIVQNFHVLRNQVAAAWQLIIIHTRNAANAIRGVAGFIIGSVYSIAGSIWAVGGQIFSALISPFIRAQNFIGSIAGNIGRSISNAIPAGVRNLIPGFAGGGIVGGASFSGDRVLTRVNSGEMILNRDQQQNLFDMLQGGGMGGAGLTIQNVNINDRADADYFLNALDNRQRLAKLGAR